jgi:hypothetical protein
MKRYIITEGQLNRLLTEDDSKKKGFEILNNLIKKHFPYVISIEPQYEDSYGTTLRVNVNIDLNKFYKFTNTTPPESYLQDYMLDLLKEPGMYMRRYVDDQYRDEALKINDKIDDLMNKYYGLVPPGMRITKFEGKSDEYFERTVTQSRDPELFIRWRDEKEPINLEVNYFYPQVDVSKL